MSGLEPLVALSLVCNVFQVIGFGQDTVGLIKNVYRDASPDPSLADHAAILNQFSLSVQNPNKREQYEQQLLSVAKKCQDVVRDLQEEIAFIVGHAKKGSLKATLSIVAKANWRKRRLDRLEKQLSDAEKLMQSGLLVRICKETDAMQLDLGTVNQTLRHFLQQYEKGCQNASDLVSQEALQTRKQITLESSKTEKALRSQITRELGESEEKLKSHISRAADRSTHDVSQDLQRLHLDTHRQIQCEQVLKSFKFVGMNERRNQTRPSYSGTFQWLFAEDDSESYGASSQEHNSDGSDRNWNSSDSDSTDWSNLDVDDIDVNNPHSDTTESHDSVSEHSETHYSDVNDSDAGDKDAGDTRSDGSISHDPDSEDEVVQRPAEIHWDSLTDWLKSNGSIYWISGKPGSGKTTLIKYIISHPQTKSALNVWNPETVIISHFLWRAGNSMQQNIKGMLCSLLHQLLSRSLAVLNTVRSELDGVETKDDDTDWSLMELETLSLKVMRRYSQSICIFLDGLDEVDPMDGFAKLYSLIIEFEAMSHVKVCLSSRPEPPIQKRLGHYPCLRLQELTKGDIRKYAKAHVQFPPEHPSRNLVKDHAKLVDTLVDKAEGVFLWLYLAIGSINRGLEHQDNFEDILKRTEALPEDLVNLYKDMWRRANDDLDLYRQSAARYFKLVIACKTLSSDPFTATCLGASGLNVFHMMLASTGIADHFLGRDEDVIPAQDLLERCEDTKRKVRTRCTGLLELSNEEEHEDLGHSWYGQEYACLVPYASSLRAFQFVHRTAHDFLIDTTDGQEILKHDGLSETQLLLEIMKACIVTCQMFLLSMPERYPNPKYQIRNSVSEYCRALKACDPLEQGDSNTRAEWSRLILLCEQLCVSGRLLRCYLPDPSIAPNFPISCQSSDFLLEAAQQGLDDFILLALSEERLSNATKSEALLLLMGHFGPQSPSRRQLCDELLSHGADPNWNIFNTYGHRSYSFPLETPFALFLTSTASMYAGVEMSILREGRSEDILLDALKSIGSLIRHGGNLEEPVYLDFSFSRPQYLGTYRPEELGIGKIRHKHGIALIQASDLIQALLTRLQNQNAQLYESHKVDDGIVSFLELQCAECGRSSQNQVVAIVRKNDYYIPNLVMYAEVTVEDSDHLMEIVLEFLASNASFSLGNELNRRFKRVLRNYTMKEGAFPYLMRLGLASPPFRRTSKSVNEVMALLKDEGLPSLGGREIAIDGKGSSSSQT